DGAAPEYAVWNERRGAGEDRRRPCAHGAGVAEESAHGRCRGVGREDARPSLWGLPEADDGAGGLGAAAHRGCGARAVELAFCPVDPAGDPGLGGAAIWTAVVRSPRGHVTAGCKLIRAADRKLIHRVEQIGPCGARGITDGGPAGLEALRR